jgi:hypothetical protein
MSPDEAASEPGLKEPGMPRDTKNVVAEGQPLSLSLHLPDRLYFAGARRAENKFTIDLHVRNRGLKAWEGDSANGPMLEVVILDSKGHEKFSSIQFCRMLAYPTVLSPGRGFSLTINAAVPDTDPSNETYRVQARFLPGTETVSGVVAVERRGRLISGFFHSFSGFAPRAA